MKKILFIGSFLHKVRGTFSTLYKLSLLLSDEFNVSTSSSYKNKLLRLLDIVLKCLFSNFDFAIVGAFSDKAFIIAEISVKICKFRKKNIIIALHGGKLPEFYQQNPKRVERLFQKADRILTPSLYLRQFFQEKGFTVDYLPNSIDLRSFPYAMKRCNSAKLLWVRAFSPIYQPSLAVETLYHVRKQFPAATLTMVGPDKGELQKIKDLIASLHLEQAVEIIGPVPNNDLYRYYHSHSVFLNTTAYESFGVAVMEAAACGIPVVSTPPGEIPLLWKNDKEMLITDSWEPNEMALAVLKLLNDTEKAESLRQQARRKAEGFDWEIVKQQWLDVL